RADEAGLDLVLVAENGVPPVCRLMDFKKKQYEAKRSQRDAKKKQQAQKVKEVKFHATIDKHDFDIKVKNIRTFLDKGHKVKVSLYLRGREMGFKDQAMEIMNKVVEELNDIGTVEAAPKMINRSIHMVIANNPSKKK
ncbi:MAG: translation initiation factor IF-3, partial [Lentisphaeria bacterium]